MILGTSLNPIIMQRMGPGLSISFPADVSHVIAPLTVFREASGREGARFTRKAGKAIYSFCRFKLPGTAIWLDQELVPEQSSSAGRKTLL